MQTYALACFLPQTGRRKLQDPTNHPDWTGREVRQIKEESRAAKFIAKFGRRGVRSEEAPTSE